MVKLYLAGAFKSRSQVDKIALFAKNKGFDVVSTWHEPDGDCRNVEDIHPLELEQIAGKDCEQIRECDVLLCLTSEHSETGGMYWEAGYATGLGKDVWYFGPITNIFTADRFRYDYLSSLGEGLAAMLTSMRNRYEH